MKMTENCKICGHVFKEGECRLGCSKGTICMKCSKDIHIAKYQPMNGIDDVLWYLAETFFRRGKGEDVTFEKVWDENETMPMIRFEDMFKRRKGK